mmetsp:Transcript_11870/g.19596  ORF Transcript_11870/g.19596 Transcript_11870/m.19596 type:complete len:89 (+) Transcript_11870:65-331(+)
MHSAFVIVFPIVGFASHDARPLEKLQESSAEMACTSAGKLHGANTVDNWDWKIFSIQIPTLRFISPTLTTKAAPPASIILGRQNVLSH